MDRTRAGQANRARRSGRRTAPDCPPPPPRRPGGSRPCGTRRGADPQDRVPLRVGRAEDRHLGRGHRGRTISSSVLGQPGDVVLPLDVLPAGGPHGGPGIVVERRHFEHRRSQGGSIVGCDGHARPDGGDRVVGALGCEQDRPAGGQVLEQLVEADPVAVDRRSGRVDDRRVESPQDRPDRPLRDRVQEGPRAAVGLDGEVVALRAVADDDQPDPARRPALRLGGRLEHDVEPVDPAQRPDVADDEPPLGAHGAGRGRDRFGGTFDGRVGRIERLEVHPVGQVAHVIRGQPASVEVVAHPGQERDHDLGAADEERLDPAQQTLPNRALAQGAEIDQRLRPQVADLEHEPGPTHDRRQPRPEGGERMDGRADDHARTALTGRHDQERDDERQHVQLAAPGVAAIGDGPEPHEADAVERVGPEEAARRDPVVTARHVAEPGGEDRHLVAAPHELPGEVEVARPVRAVRRVGVVVDHPDPGGHREDRPRLRAGLDQPRDAVDEHARLAGPRAGENHQRAVAVLDGGPLLGVEGRRVPPRVA